MTPSDDFSPWEHQLAHWHDIIIEDKPQEPLSFEHFRPMLGPVWGVITMEAIDLPFSWDRYLEHFREERLARAAGAELVREFYRKWNTMTGQEVRCLLGIYQANEYRLPVEAWDVE